MHKLHQNALGQLFVRASCVWQKKPVAAIAQASKLIGRWHFLWRWWCENPATIRPISDWGTFLFKPPKRKPGLSILLVWAVFFENDLEISTLQTSCDIVAPQSLLTFWTFVLTCLGGQSWVFWGEVLLEVSQVHSQVRIVCQGTWIVEASENNIYIYMTWFSRGYIQHMAASNNPGTLLNRRSMFL